MLVRKPSVESLNSGCFDLDRHPQIERVSRLIIFWLVRQCVSQKIMQQIARSKRLVSTELEIKTWTTTVWIESLRPPNIKPSICSFKHCCQPWPMKQSTLQQGDNRFLPFCRNGCLECMGKLCRAAVDQWFQCPRGWTAALLSGACHVLKKWDDRTAEFIAAQLHKQHCSWGSRRIPLLENCSDVCVVCLDIGLLVTPKSWQIVAFFDSSMVHGL